MELIKRLYFSIILTLLVIFLGTLGFMHLEGYSFLDALWFTVITIATVGYGDIVPVTIGGKLFTLVIILAGISLVFYIIGTFIGPILEGHLKNFLGRASMLKKIAQLENHIIICGAGRVGIQIINRLKKEGVPFVVIEQDEEVVQEMFNENVLVLHGDATADETLEQAGIRKARGLVASLPDDAENVFITLTSKGINPRVQVVARCHKPESESKLRRAGADKVISPEVIGGRRMAISILKPASVDFVETLMHYHNVEIEIEEISIPDHSPIVNKPLRESGIKDETGAMVVAIKRGEDFLYNPSASETIRSEDLLIVLGTREQLGKLERLAAGTKTNGKGQEV